MKKKKIRVLEIKPMEHPRVCSIEPSKEAFECAVGAYLKSESFEVKQYLACVIDSIVVSNNEIELSLNIA